jgi:integrase
VLGFRVGRHSGHPAQAKGGNGEDSKEDRQEGDIYMKGCRPLTDSEIATVKGTFVRTRDKALFILGLKTVLRISELLSLKVGDVYQYGRLADVVYVERKHMKKKLEGRAIPLHQDAKDALRVWIKELEKACESRPQ